MTIHSTTPTRECSRSSCHEPRYSTSPYCITHKSAYDRRYHADNYRTQRNLRPFIEVPTEFDSTKDALDAILELSAQNPDGILVAQDIMRSKVYEWLQDSDEFYRVATAESSIADEFMPHGDWVEMSDGTKIKIFAHRNPRSGQIKSGTFQISRTKGVYRNGKIRQEKQTATVYDVKGFLGKRVDDVAATMASVRDSLLSVGLVPKSQAWHRFSSIGDALMDDLVGVDYVHPTTYKTPRVLHAGIQGHRMFGHTNQPTYGYDINGAYLAELYKLGGPYMIMAKTLWEARQTLRTTDPIASKVLKLVPAAIVGKFASPESKYYNPGLAQYIYTQVQYRLKRIMKMIRQTGGDVVRFHTDGGIGTSNAIHLLEEGDGLGEIRLEVYPSLTMVNTGIFWAGNEHRHGSLTEGILSEEQVLEHWQSNPYEPLVVEDMKFSIFNLDWYPEERRISSGTHVPSRCRACKNNLGGPATTLHDIVGREDDEVVYRTRG